MDGHSCSKLQTTISMHVIHVASGVSRNGKARLAEVQALLVFRPPRKSFAGKIDHYYAASGCRRKIEIYGVSPSLPSFLEFSFTGSRMLLGSSVKMGNFLILVGLRGRVMVSNPEDKLALRLSTSIVSFNRICLENMVSETYPSLRLVRMPSTRKM